VDARPTPPWNWLFGSTAPRDEDAVSFHSAPGDDGVDDTEATASTDDGSNEDANAWKYAFAGLWRLERHQDDYDHWLALKGLNRFKRKIAASLPATKRFDISDGADHIVHVYTLAGALELTQRWSPSDASTWKPEHENGQTCLISTEWRDGSLVVRKRFEQLGIEEEVENALAADGTRLIATMRTTVVSTQETRCTRDTFVRA